MSLWDNIRKRRAAGKPRLKPGQKGYPKTLKVDEITTTASIPNPAQTAMGPRKGISYVHDRRRKRGQSVMLKRFRKYLEDKGVY